MIASVEGQNIEFDSDLFIKCPYAYDVFTYSVKTPRQTKGTGNVKNKTQWLNMV